MHAFLLAAALSLPAQFTEAADALLRRRTFAHSSLGVAIYDLDRHRMLLERNAERYFLAASTTKLLTEGTALWALGTDYRFHTNVYRTGPVSGGTLRGDVVLRASGDPNLSGRITAHDTLAFENEDHSYDGDAATRAVPGDPLAVLRDFARQVRARGIRRITGSVVVDDSLFPGGFAESGTGTTVSPIVVNDNIIDVTVSPGSAPGEPVHVSIAPETPYAHFYVNAVTGAAGGPRSIEVVSHSAPDDPVQSVSIDGTMPAGCGPILYAYDVPSPRRFAEAALTGALAAAGVTVQSRDSAAPLSAYARTYKPANLIAVHASPPLSEDVKVTLKVSDNLHADTMPYIWGSGNLTQAFAVERRFLQSAHLRSSGVVQNDGLGGNAFIEPSFMVRYLDFLRTQPFFSALYAGLPVLGVDGTLYNVETHSPAAGNVRAKTGTWVTNDLLNGRKIVTDKGLAGYITTASGRHLAFCFYVNNLTADDNPEGSAGDLLAQLAALAYSDL